LKRIIFITSIFIHTILTLTAQTYNPLPLGNTKWQAVKSALMQGNKSYCFFSKDTLGYFFGGNKYWRVEFLQTPSYSNSSNGVYVFDDTTQHKIFVIDTNTNSIHLLYDFTVNPNDTLYNLYNNIDGNVTIDSIVVVDSVKFIGYNGLNRKTIFVHGGLNSVPQVWIEGIGADNLLQPSFHPPLFEFGWNLTCQEYNNIITFGDSIECSNFLTSVKNLEITSEKINITVSQSANILRIENPNTIRYNLTIIDLAGKIICRRNTNYAIEDINLSNYQNFLLIYKIESFNNQQVIGKVYVEQR
jgi:hypothetical protein